MGIKDILVITTPDQQDLFKETLKGIESVNLTFTIQPEPKGLPEAFVIAEKWLDGDDVTLILGDNIFIDSCIPSTIPNTIFTYQVKHPERYGVVERDPNNMVIRLVEKPTEFVSDEAVVGLYCLKNKVCELAKKLKPSKRKETEIVDLINQLNRSDLLKIKKIKGFWFDAGNHDDLLDCANFVRAIEQRTDRTFDLK